MGSNRILTTHTGSLPRPPDLVELLRERHAGRAIARGEFDAAVAAAVEDVVKMQVEAGVDIVNDGEMSKVSYSYYVQERLDGLSPAADAELSGAPLRKFQSIETVDPAFPDFATAFRALGRGPDSASPPVCTGPLVYAGSQEVAQDLANLRDAARIAGAERTFMTAASPGVIAMFASRTSHYMSEDDYVFGLADAMRLEYEAIHRAGVMLQIDCPDLALAPHMNYEGREPDFHRIIARNIEALNLATANIPPHAMRVHLCWGNYPGPHARDLEVRHLFAHLRKLRARAVSFEGANPRHEHEWEDWRDADLPDDMVVIPGVIDSTTNFVEHPRLVAQRILNYARSFGAERVIAGVDCGFGTFATQGLRSFPTIVRAKLTALAQGAEFASGELISPAM
jgi:5-methyltetrahydropteroyltriglutamate--homocysteine methyltransferase